MRFSLVVSSALALLGSSAYAQVFTGAAAPISFFNGTMSHGASLGPSTLTGSSSVAWNGEYTNPYSSQPYQADTASEVSVVTASQVTGTVRGTVWGQSLAGDRLAALNFKATATLFADGTFTNSFTYQVVTIEGVSISPNAAGSIMRTGRVFFSDPVLTELGGVKTLSYQPVRYDGLSLTDSFAIAPIVLSVAPSAPEPGPLPLLALGALFVVRRRA